MLSTVAITKVRYFAGMNLLRCLTPWLLAVGVGAVVTLWASEGRPAEPVTFWTDYILAAQAAVFGALLVRFAGSRHSALAYGWAGVFTAVCLAAAMGGSSHALAPYVSTTGLWRGTLWAIGLAAYFLGAVTVLLRVDRARRRPVWFGLGAILAIYAGWVFHDSRFEVAIAYYGSALALLLAVESVSWIRHRTPGARWLIAAVLVCVAAAAVQQTALSIGSLNHNDLYHVIQFLGAWLMFRGARRRVSAADPSDGGRER